MFCCPAGKSLREGVFLFGWLVGVELVGVPQCFESWEDYW